MEHGRDPERGKPIGRRIFLGTLGLGALGVVSAPVLQRGLEGFLGEAAQKDPTGLTGLLPNGGGFRYYSVTASVPRKNAGNYRLTVGGLVDRPASYTLDDLRALPQTRMVKDVQCVTGWRVPDTPFEGVRLSELLDAAGVKYPKGVDDAWTADEFDAALKALKAKDSDGKVLDIQEGNGLANEWGTYGFAPIVWSAGGGLLKDGKAEGALDSPAAVSALKTFQSWKGTVDPNTDGNAFAKGRVALSWVGHWMYPAYSEALGDDLVVLPLPDFGDGPKTGQGSWSWGIGADSKNAKAAGAFMDFLLDDANVTAMTKANGAPPATKSALAASELYKQGGPLQLFADQLAKPCGDSDISKSCVAVTRPVTAGYPVVTEKFSQALNAIYGGGDPKDALSKAARAIDRDFSDNAGYEIP
nr:extracellular solute-binding protein [Streptomyces ossamyceticus]